MTDPRHLALSTAALALACCCLLPFHAVEGDSCRRRKLFSCARLAGLECVSWGYFYLTPDNFLFCRGRGFVACECLCGRFGPTLHALVGICKQPYSAPGGSGGNDTNMTVAEGVQNTSVVTLAGEDNVADTASGTNLTFLYAAGLDNVSSNGALQRFMVLVDNARKMLKTNEHNHSSPSGGRLQPPHRHFSDGGGRGGAGGGARNVWPYSRVPGNGYVLLGRRDPQTILSDPYRISGSIIAAVTVMVLLISLVPALWFYRKAPPGKQESYRLQNLAPGRSDVTCS